MNLIDLLALGSPPPPGTETNPKAQLTNTLLLLVVMGVMFYFLLIRPQSKQRKEHENLIKNVRSGDEILTTGGLYGIVTNVKDRELTVKIADNVKVRIAKSAIAGVVKKTDDAGSSSSDSK